MSLMVSVSGIRGIVGESLSPQVAGDYAAAFAVHLRCGTVVIGRDPRPSGQAISAAVVRMLTRCGCPVIDLGITTTPATALMVRLRRAAGGIVVTASHNPGQWNGLKFLTADGAAVPLETARAIWAIHDQRGFVPAGDHHAEDGAQDSAADQEHVAAVLQHLRTRDIIKRKLKVVLDSINGAGCRSGRLLLEALGCDVVHLNSAPTGLFAHPPEPTEEHLGELCEAVRQHGADLGCAQDPDADRLAIVDHTGTYLGEEYTLALAAKHIFATHPGPAATNLSTSRMIDDLAHQAGGPCTVHRTAVGEANVVEALRSHDCVIGGEGNGGVIDPRVGLVRDSLVAMGLALQMLADEDRPLSAVVDSMPRYCMIKRKVACPRDEIDALLQAVKRRCRDQAINDTDGVRIDWPDAWVHVRASNTEPVIRIIAEAPDRQRAEYVAAEVLRLAGTQ